MVGKGLRGRETTTGRTLFLWLIFARTGITVRRDGMAKNQVSDFPSGPDSWRNIAITLTDLGSESWRHVQKWLTGGPSALGRCCPVQNTEGGKAGHTHAFSSFPLPIEVLTIAARVTY
jgi:hypothetical protein